MQSVLSSSARVSEQERDLLKRKLGMELAGSHRWWCCCQNMFEARRIKDGRWLLLFLPGELIHVEESEPTSSEAAENFNEKSLSCEHYMRNRARQRQRQWLETEGAQVTTLALDALLSVDTLESQRSSHTNVLLFTSETPEQQRRSLRYSRFLCEDVRTLSDWEMSWNECFDLPLYRWHNSILYKPLVCLFVDGRLRQFDADLLAGPAQVITNLLNAVGDT